MWEKIKTFFQNKIVQIVEWVLLFIVAVGLIIGGVTVDTQYSFLILVGGVVDAIALVITFITKLTKK